MTRQTRSKEGTVQRSHKRGSASILTLRLALPEVDEGEGAAELSKASLGQGECILGKTHSIVQGEDRIGLAGLFSNLAQALGCVKNTVCKVDCMRIQ